MSSVWRKSSKRASARRARHAAHSHQASLAAFRALEPTGSRPFASCVTTPLYRIAVCHNQLVSTLPLVACQHAQANAFACQHASALKGLAFQEVVLARRREPKT